MSRSLHRSAVQVRPVRDQLDDVEHRPSRHCSNERKKCLRTVTVAAIEECKPHAHSLPIAFVRAASAVSYCRVACPTAAHTTISKDLVFTAPRHLRSSDVVIGDPIGLLCDLID